MTAREALCPNCGAAIVFRWSGAVQTTCPACRSVLVRHDLSLERVGTVGDVPAAMSPIQLGTEGRANGVPFTVVGRIVYAYERGHWSEWYLRLGDGTDAWLSDAQGDYALTRLTTPDERVPRADEVQVGERWTFGGTRYEVTSVTTAHYAGVEGELPFEYWDKTDVPFADLETEGAQFATLDFSEPEPLLYVGAHVDFDALAMRNLRDDAAAPVGAAVGEAQGGPAVRGLNCPNCGAAIVLRAGALTQTVACSACAAVLDATDPSYRVLQRFTERMIWRPALALGSTGAFDGHRWRVIGFQVRDVTVEGMAYAWREYLLWNPERGFRYLTEYDGHWNDVVDVRGVPQQRSGGDQPTVEWEGVVYKHFQSATATTRFILGEFPWEVRMGDQVRAHDFVAPPRMLSREEAGNEATWSRSTYTEPTAIAATFGLEKPLPHARGVYANQPNPSAGSAQRLGRLFSLFAAVVMVLLVARAVAGAGPVVFDQNYLFDQTTGDTLPFVTPIFTLGGRTSNVAVEIDSDVENDWAFFNLALINVGTGDAYDFGREVSYYHGVDEGESWTEGSRRDRAVLSSVPSGRYYLRVAPERDPGTSTIRYSVRVRRDVPRYGWFFGALGLLLVPVLGSWFGAQSFENARWKESDHAPVITSSSDDDD